MNGKRVYLDYNATAPLTKPCEQAMIETMGFFGNASSIHFEGRRARSIIENAREQISTALDVEPENLCFTSGATEGAALLLKGEDVVCAGVEHACVGAWCDQSLEVTTGGKIKNVDQLKSSIQSANSETGILQELPKNLYMSDVAQVVGKMDFSFKRTEIQSAIVSAHKFGGPQGIGAVIADPILDIKPQLIGGGQEKGRRSGTESLVAIAGFGAAVKFAKTLVDDGVSEKIQEFRDYLEDELANSSKNTIFVGKKVDRLPNTSCIITPGWSGQLQVMRMDLDGFSISAGSACSSGTLSPNKALIAMGFNPKEAECSIRISIGTQTTKDEIHAFVKAWSRARIDQIKQSAELVA